MTTRLLEAYDAQLRGSNEMRNARGVQRLGPLWLGVLGGDFGFITYRDLGGLDREARRALVGAALDRLRADPAVRVAEWKTRQHDDLPGLHEDLVEAGFEPGEPESIMVGEAALLADDLPAPDGVRLRAVTGPDEVRAASAMVDRVFGDEPSEARVQDLLGRIAAGAELWVAEAGGEVVSAGRLEPVPGTAFAGLWGGATRADHRRRGIYRALTAARARSAVARGVRYLNSDSTEASRPILERAGLQRVSTTTPYRWSR